jgi:NADPH-dependent curcumin reductase CurA
MTSSPPSTRSWVLANYPQGNPTFSSTDDKATFKIVSRPLPKLAPNQVLVKALYLSNDPAQRGWIESSIPAERMYTKPVQLDEPMHAYGLGEVVATTSQNLPVGTVVQGSLGWSEYVVLNEEQCSIRNPLPGGLSLTHYLGAFGGPGLTAYYGLVIVGGAQKGMKVVVSGAAGATGSMVVQIAKNVSLPSTL